MTKLLPPPPRTQQNHRKSTKNHFKTTPTHSKIIAHHSEQPEIVFKVDFVVLWMIFDRFLVIFRDFSWFLVTSDGFWWKIIEKPKNTKNGQKSPQSHSKPPQNHTKSRQIGGNWILSGLGVVWSDLDVIFDRFSMILPHIPKWPKYCPHPRTQENHRKSTKNEF